MKAILLVEGKPQLAAVIQQLQDLGFSVVVEQPSSAVSLETTEVSQAALEMESVEAIPDRIQSYIHELSNPLTVAIGNLNWLRKNCEGEDNKQRIERADRALKKMAQILTQIRAENHSSRAAAATTDELSSASQTTKKTA